MKILTITGLRPLCGELTVHGCKNAVLPILAAAAAVPGQTVLRRCPPIRDVHTALGLLGSLGLRATLWEQTAVVDRGPPVSAALPAGLAGAMRSSVLFAGALLTACGEAHIPLPGGCKLGKRPLDLHLSGLERLGVRVEILDGVIHCRGPVRGGTVYLRYPSVGATENLLLAALGAREPVTLFGAAREPEIADLCAFLRACGANVRGSGSLLRVEPAPLHGAEYTVMPDRMEAATYLAAVAAAGGSLALRALRPRDLAPVLDVLERSGCTLRRGEDWVQLWAAGLQSPGLVRTGPHPAFPTDAQAPIMAALLRAEGITVFQETVFENRYRHVPALRALGAEITLSGQLARVRGVPTLRGAAMEATDLRGAAAMVVGALSAQGTSRMTDPGHLCRGYAALAPDLRSLGAEIHEQTLHARRWQHGTGKENTVRLRPEQGRADGEK